MFKSDIWLKATKILVISTCNQAIASLSKMDLVNAYVHPLTQTLLHTTEEAHSGLNGHQSITDSTRTSYQKGSYLHINSPIKE